MWFISGDNLPCIWLRPGKIFTIGRKDADIKLTDDKSVSRQHATIQVQQPTAKDVVISLLFVIYTLRFSFDIWVGSMF
jgi:hypothetical protein